MRIKMLHAFLTATLITFAFIMPGAAAEVPDNRTDTSPITDYFDCITVFSDGRITRFTHMPIQVYISSMLKDDPYLAAVRYAMREWETVSAGKIRFEEIDVPKHADIRVTWGYSDHMAFQDTRLGSAELTRLRDTAEEAPEPNGNNFRVTVILMLADDENIGKLSDAEMRTVCLHEFGHAIGLWGHSPHPNDVSYPTATAQHPTLRDINTLRKLYSTPFNTPQHDTAIDILKTEIAREPRRYSLHYRLGTVYFDKGDTESAIASFKACLRLNENFQPATEKLLSVYEEAGQLFTAVNLLKQQLERQPSASNYNTLGIHYYRQGAVDKAIAAFENAVSIEPYHKAARHNLHQLFLEKARHALNARDFTTAENTFKRAVQLKPLDLMMYRSMGDRYARAGLYPAAIQHYRAALQLNPANKLTQRHLAQCYNNYGVTLRNSGHWDEAIAAYRNALEVQPTLHIAQTNLSDVFWQRARTYYKSGQVDKAIAAYLELQELHPKDTEIFSMLGDLYLKKGNYPAAVSAFQKVRAAKPHLHSARHNLVVAYHHTAQDLMRQKNYRAAIDPLQKALALSPTTPGLRVSLARAYQNIGDYRRAQAELAYVLALAPENQQATTEQINLHISRGNVLMQQKNYAAALAQFTSIPETERDVNIWNIIGYLYLMQDRPSEALVVFERVLALEPLNISAYQNLLSLESRLNNRRDTTKMGALIRTRCLLAISLMNRKQPDAALVKYKQAKDNTSAGQYYPILFNTGGQLAHGFDAQNDTERSAKIRRWLEELTHKFGGVIDR